MPPLFENLVTKIILREWHKLDLDDALGEISVMEADEVPNNPENLSGWYAVVDTLGINAYFSTKTEALAYRLFLINRIFNG